MLNPRNIAFIGTFSVIRQGILNCLAMGFTGGIYIVHKTRKEIEGIPCYTSISDLPVGLDAAYLAIRNESTVQDRKSTRLNSSHVAISYAVFCLKKKKY